MVRGVMQRMHRPRIRYWPITGTLGPFPSHLLLCRSGGGSTIVLRNTGPGDLATNRSVIEPTKARASGTVSDGFGTGTHEPLAG